LNLVPDHVVLLLLFTRCRIGLREEKEADLAEEGATHRAPPDEDRSPHCRLLELMVPPPREDLPKDDLEDLEEEDDDDDDLLEKIDQPLEDPDDEDDLEDPDDDDDLPPPPRPPLPPLGKAPT